MFPKHAEIQITRGTQGLGNSLRVGESPRVTTRIRTDVTQPRSNPNRTTRTDTAQTGGVRRFNTGALNTQINPNNLGGGNISGR